MFKIGEFSQLVRVSTRMLRHYDKLGLLIPEHTDPITGYRFYTVEQIPRLHRIVALNGIGLTLQQIAVLLQRDNSLPTEQLRGMLLVRQVEMEQELHSKEIALASVAARLAQLESGPDTSYEITVTRLEVVQVASIRTVVPTLGEMDDACRQIYDRLASLITHYAVPSGTPCISFFHNKEYVEVDLDVEMAIPIARQLTADTTTANGLTLRTVPGAELAAALVYEGPYQGVETAVFALLNWIGHHGYVLDGPFREVHLSGPAHFDGHTHHSAIIELQAPVRAASV